MKRILTTIAILTWGSSLNAATPAELIQTIYGHFSIQHVREARTSGHARRVDTPKNKAVKISKRHPSHRKVHKRRFRTHNEYRRMRRAPKQRYKYQHINAKKVYGHRSARRQKLGHYVGNGWFVDDNGQYDEEYDRYIWIPSHSHRQHPYRHYRRQWYLTYLYERAEFYDRYGYHYGYFDRHGFVFDGIYYGYDYAYTYQDRLHGKGLFGHRFYRPKHSRRMAYRF